jgi:hypothetical protein
MASLRVFRMVMLLRLSDSVHPYPNRLLSTIAVSNREIDSL